MNDLINRIHDIPIREIIEKHTQLTKAGINFKAKCPFPGHEEKTASFIVNPNKNRCQCYGCGKGGDAITFIQLVRGYAKPWEAILEIAKAYNLPIPEKRELTPDEQKERKKADQFKVVYEAAAGFYYENLKKPEHSKHYEYALSRTNQEMIDRYEIGLADTGWQSLYDHLKSKGFKNDFLLESGLIKESKSKFYDFFRARIMFPITDRSGSVIAFSGRLLPDEDDTKTGKYLNSPESIIYHKERTLLGLTQARTAIAKKEGVYLVEGNFDVTRLVSLGIENTIAPCGTALTTGQLQEIKRYTQNLVLIFDRDPAGTKAIERSGLLAVDAGFNCSVLWLPDIDGKKADPDSFFTSAKQFKEYKDVNRMDFLYWKAFQYAETIKNFPDRKSNSINELSKLIIKYENASRREIYIDELSKIIPSRQLWKKEIDTLTKEKTKKEKVSTIPQGLEMADVMRWGFYVDNNCYFFKRGESFTEGSNFIMKPLFHIQSTINAKRLYEVVNEHSHTEVIELLQKDLVSLQAFKLRIESLGNFLWTAGDAELNKLKSYLYEKTDTCFEITQLGWQKHGFFAWANGIYNGEFTPTDKHGIVDHKSKKYYLPALSDIYDKDETLFMSERRFIHMQKSNISLYDYCQKLITVFGPNAKIAIAFYIATLYRDIIVRKFNFYPILNLFGPKGAGKTELAVSIMAFFGKQSKGPNINNTSKASLADHVAQVSNACVHIDEYKNNIDFEKIEFLKGLWDCTGRTRMNMDKDKKKETTAVDCGIILSGQEMPTADIALFSRLIYLTFNKVEYTDDEKKAFNELKDIEKKGLTHITNEVLSHREHIMEYYINSYDKTCEMLNKYLNTDIIEDRLFKNWAVILAAFVCIEETKALSLPFNSEEMISQAAKQLLIQQQQTRTGNEVTTFWNVVNYLAADGDIQEESDYSIKSLLKLKTQTVSHEWAEPKRVIFIQQARILPLYSKYGKTTGEKTLPKESIDFYIRNDRRFLGKKLAHSFKNIDPKTGVHLTDKPWKTTTAYAFDYDALSAEIGITLSADVHSSDEGDLFKRTDDDPEKINDCPY